MTAVRKRASTSTAETPASNLRLLLKSDLSRELGVSIWTIDRWVKAGRFPKPIFVSEAAPARWRLRDVEAWLAKRQVARHKPRPLQGCMARVREARRST
jgi:predicted DNA-binding transcriptional regulator AlpA